MPGTSKHFHKYCLLIIAQLLITVKNFIGPDTCEATVLNVLGKLLTLVLGLALKLLSRSCKWENQG